MSSPKSPPSMPQEPPPYFHPTIQTPRLLLRSPLPEDIEPLHLIRTNPEVAKWHNPSHTTDPVSDTEAWLDRIFEPQKTFSFIIQLLSPTPSESNAGSSGPVIGVLGMTINPKTSLPSVGYFIASEYWSQGYITEAISASLSEYWKVYPNGLPGSTHDREDGRPYVHARVVAMNVGSARVLEKNGFELVGTEEVEDWHTGSKIQIGKYKISKPDH